jgi:predicted Fe-Mo cluster-binding NifX family protein
MTRLAVPVVLPEGLSSKVNEHFARSEYFAIIDTNEDDIVSADVIHCAPEDDKKKAEFLADRGVNIVLAGRIGSCMMRILMDRGVVLFSGADGTVKDAFFEYRSGKLTEVRPNPYQL